MNIGVRGPSGYADANLLERMIQLTCGLQWVANAQLVCNVSSNALTVQLKTAHGSDPSPSDPVIVGFRVPSATNSAPVVRRIAEPLSLVISSTSTMGFTSSVSGRLWITVFDDDGQFRLAAINCLSGRSIYRLSGWGVASVTAEGGAGAADSAHTFYSQFAVTSKSYVTLGYAEWIGGLSVAGTWDAAPTRVQMIGLGVPLPGAIVQRVVSQDSAAANTQSTIPVDNTIPQVGEGAQFTSLTMTPGGGANLLDVEAALHVTNTVGSNVLTAAIFRDGGADAIAAVAGTTPGNDYLFRLSPRILIIAQSVASTTFSVRYGATTGSPQSSYVNRNNAGSLFNGTNYSYLSVTELMA